jgi:hypothetical protein
MNSPGHADKLAGLSKSLRTIRALSQAADSIDDVAIEVEEQIQINGDSRKLQQLRACSRPRRMRSNP